MPVVLKIGVLKFFFYSNEGNPVKAPHIHVRGNGGEAKISLTYPYPVLLNSGFGASDLRKVCALVKEYQEILQEAYRVYFT
jgi:hypothetical protein